MKRKPPRKKRGQGVGVRRIGGVVLGVKELSEEWGLTQKTVRARVDRGLLPYRKWGGRIVFLRHEVLDFFSGLSGITAAEAIQNDRRYGGE